ncbi:MAG: NAD(P)-binding domain-containing protein [Bacteroidetes bacterium]|nr:NAD(P)-binding domain-containing protein [Bacteroidota bacterium]
MILIADEMHPALIQGLQERQIPFHYQPEISLLEVLDIIAQYEGLIVRTKFFIDKNFINQASRLQFIARAGSGTDNIELDYANQRGIVVLNAPEGLCDAVAEHTIGLILALQHKIIKSNNEVKNLQWNREENRGIELMNSTVGIIGFGHTGSAVARKLHGFGARIMAYDKYKTAEKRADGFFFDDNATSCSLNTIYEQADILTMHVPLTKETEGWVNKDFFKKFKKSIVFINTSRGKIVNTTDLLEALQGGKLTGAALDVLEQEPPFSEDGQPDATFNALRDMENVIFTPHIAGWSAQSYERISTVLCAKIINFYQSKSNSE